MGFDLQTVLDKAFNASLEPEKWEGVCGALQDLHPWGGIELFCFEIRKIAADQQSTESPDRSAAQRQIIISPVVILDCFDARHSNGYSHEEGAEDANPQLPETEHIESFVKQHTASRGFSEFFYDQSNLLIMSVMPSGHVDAEHQAKLKHDLGYLFPHIRQSFLNTKMRLKQKQESQSVSQFLDHLASAAFVLNHQGRVIDTNKKAKDLSLLTDTLIIDGRDNLAFVDKGADAALKAAFKKLQSGETENLRGQFLSRGPDHTYYVSIKPLNPHSGAHITSDNHPFALLTLNNIKEKNDRHIANLRDLFGLTPAEAKLAMALFDGISLADYAAQSSLSVHTARNQLKMVFSKTGTSRQGEFVSLLAKLEQF